MRFIGTTEERDLRQVLMDYLPKYYENSKVVNEMIKSDSIELEDIYANVTDVLMQTFVSTATWGLDIWEKELDLPTNLGETYEVRRAKIIGKLRGASTFNKQAALELAKSFSYVGLHTWFKENGDGTFTTGFEVDDLIDYEEMIQAFDSAKPAHLAHLVHLLMFINFSPNIVEKLNIKSEIKQLFYVGLEENLLLKIKEKVFLNSKYEVGDLSELLINGSWLLDGSKNLNGFNSDGINLYFTDPLKITVYKDGIKIEEETV